MIRTSKLLAPQARVFSKRLFAASATRYFRVSAPSLHAHHAAPVTAVPKSQKAVYFETNNGPLIYKTDFPVPKPANDEILVHVQYSGVCHTDLHAWRGDWPLPTKLPLVGGHEGSGVVVAIGENVTNFKVGDLAGIKWLNGSCLGCEFCLKGAESNCKDAILTGYTHDGTFQEYATAKAVHAAKLPVGTDLAQIAPILCAGITVYKALKVSETKAGEWVAITGAGGGLGSLAIQYAKAMGFRPVAIDTSAAKEQLCKELGAEVFIDFATSKDISKDIIAATKGGPHSVIHVAASEQAIQVSTNYVRPCGTIVLVGMPAQAQVKSDVFQHVVKTINIKGSYVGNRADTAEALEFFARGLVRTPIHIVGLSELKSVYEKMEKNQIIGRYVLDTSK